MTDRYTFTEGMFSKYVSTGSTTNSYGKYGSSSEIDFSAGPANNLNIDVLGIDWTGEEIYSCPLHLLGVGGKRSDRLPSEYKARYADLNEDGNVEGEGDDYTITLKYKKDGDYIVSIEQYRDEALYTTVEITYED